MSLQWHYSLFFVLVHDLRAFTSTDTNMPRGSQQKKMAHLEKKSQKERSFSAERKKGVDLVRSGLRIILRLGLRLIEKNWS
ncbi:hypothetical protein CKAN_01360300 [Cinnamomum micranthum f. kanehirae]|uniref:Uncharacterized protein n=1 Tax=Cinnamomum micranthum f. kanehirae TaxID=337451 RepID=A0A3S3QI73_9MAGN|nr:hypothetical protein CKAN_01360300 [Cinnamomum micranthum f. kanehirae]